MSADPSAFTSNSNFLSIFNDALKSYKRKTKEDLASHPLLPRLQTCSSPDAIITLLREQVPASSRSRNDDNELTRWVTPTVNVMWAFSATIGQSVPLVFPPANAIFAGIGALLLAVKDTSTSREKLNDIFNSIEHFFRRLEIYTGVTPNTAMTDVIVEIMVEVLTILAIVTMEVRHGQLKMYLKKLTRSRDVEDSLQRLDKLTQERARMASAELLKMTHGVDGRVIGVDDRVKSVEVKVLDVRDDVQEVGNMVRSDVQDTRDKVQDIDDRVQGVDDKLDQANRNQRRDNILRWLSPPDPYINHNITYEAHHNGTSEWLLRGSVFNQWKSTGSFLWIHGKPGSGKSVLCSTIIEDINHMHKRGLASLAFFYCDFRDDDKKNLRGLLSSLLLQLCHSSDSYSTILSDFYLEHDNGSRHPSDYALIGCLERILKHPGHSPIFIIIDALDECSNKNGIPSSREKVLRFVEMLVDLHLSTLHICITSRPEVDIATSLRPLPFHQVTLHDEVGQIKDIVDYIESVVDTDPRTKRWRAEDKELVKEVLTKNCGGMFRWVFCQFEVLRHCLPSGIRHALEDLPETLDGTYEHILQDIPKTNWTFAHRLFQCLVVACRPLLVEELAEFLAFDFDAGPTPAFRADWRSEDPVGAVLSICSGLLTVVEVEGSAFVQFSHFSVKEFLTSDRLFGMGDLISRYHISLNPAHTIVAEACLGILLHLDETVTSDGLEDFPLAEYAAKHWVNHARFDNVSAIAQDGMKRLFDPRKPHLMVLVWIYDPEIPMRVLSERPSQPIGTPLHYATLTGLPDLVEFLVIEFSPDVNARSFLDDVTALHLASRDGHAEVARVLLEHGADVDARARDGQTALHRASRIGQVEVVRMLLEHGADVDARARDGQTALHRASRIGQVEVVRMLLKHGASTSARDVDKSTPLHLASRRGVVDVIRVLLEHGADVNIQSVEGWSALHHASLGGHKEVARFLLEHGADVMAQDEEGWTALHHSSRGGHMVVTRFLLEHGADATAQDLDKSTPLHLASGYGHADIARLLLEHGADANSQNESSCTPLHLASQEGHLDVVQLLLDRSETPNAKNEDQQTPLFLASSNGRSKVVQLLLENGANLNSQDWLERTPLHGASENGHFDVMLLLLNRDAKVNEKDAHSWTPLHVASKTGNFTVALELLDRGAEMEAQDDLYWTPLHMASQEGHQEVVQLLLKRGAHVDAQEADGETALHLAAYYGHHQVTRLLLDYDADVHALNKNGKAPFELASKEGYHEVAQLLLESGATPRDAPKNLSSHDQSVPKAQDTGAPIGLLPSSGAPLDPGTAYPVQGGRSQRENSPQRVDLSRTDDDAYPRGFEKSSNIASPSVDNRPISRTNSLSSYALQGFTPRIVQDEYDEFGAWFFATDHDGDGVLSSEKLCSALLNNGGLRFSINTVKYLMSIFDRESNGVIDFEEFGPLWNYVTHWRQVFDAFDVDRHGRIDVSVLRSALAYYNLHVSPYILDMTARKYGITNSRNWRLGRGDIPSRPQMDLDGFVCACVVVRHMFELYGRCSAGGRSQINRDDFLQAVMSVPSGGAQGQDAAYPANDGLSRSQQGSALQRGGFSRPDDGDYPRSFKHPESITSPSVGNLPIAHTDLSSLASPVFPSSIEQDECYALFLAIDQDGDGVLSSEELRNVLSNNGGLRLSINTVKYLMSIFDQDGVIDFEVFKPLWNYTTQWRQMFDVSEVDRNASGLRSALVHCNLHVSSYILDMTVRKYGIALSRNQHPGYGSIPARAQMNLDGFFCACVVVRHMSELYEKCSAGGRSQISRDEFLRAVISLP